MKRNGNADRRRRENRGAEGGGRGAAGAEVERRRREDRGADGGGVWGGCPPPHWGEKFLILALNMVSFGAFWMVFFTVRLPVLHAKPEFNRYMRIKAVMVSR